MAESGAFLLKRLGVGMGFLATLRKDGSPRLHPVCPALTEEGLYVFIIGRSWKYRDLVRDPRFALHAFPADEDEEFYVGGEARPVNDADVREAVIGTHHYRPGEEERLFELRLDRALHTTWTNWAKPDMRPNHTRWHL
jgi:hypothetical protein